MEGLKKEQKQAFVLAIAAVIVQILGQILPMIFSWGWNLPLLVLVGTGICAAVVARKGPGSSAIGLCGVVTILCGVLPIFLGAHNCGAVLCLLLSVLSAVMIFDLDRIKFSGSFVVTMAVIALGIEAVVVIVSASDLLNEASRSYYGSGPDLDWELELLVKRLSHLVILLGSVLTLLSVHRRGLMPTSRAWRERPMQPGRIPYTQEKKPEPKSGWTCFCGRWNPDYTSSCVCGRSKWEAAERKPPATAWRCTCGRENPNYTSTCVCGKNKRDV